MKQVVFLSSSAAARYINMLVLYSSVYGVVENVLYT